MNFATVFYTVLKGYFLNIEEVTFQIPKDIWISNNQNEQSLNNEESIYFVYVMSLIDSSNLNLILSTLCVSNQSLKRVWLATSDYNFLPTVRKPPGGVTPQPPIMMRELNGSRSLYVVFGSATIDFFSPVAGVGASIVWTCLLYTSDAADD